MKEICFFIFLMFCCVSKGQKEVDAIVGFSSDIKDIHTQVKLAYPDFDIGISFLGDLYVPFAFKGFSYYSFNGVKIPVHVDENDDFDLVVDDGMLLKDLYFKGEAGAIKNNYLLGRYFFTKEEERKEDFFKDNKDAFTQRIDFVKDSLLSIANGLALSDQFIEDETRYWKFYKDYMLTFYDVLKNPIKHKYNVLPIEPSAYPEYEFNADYYVQYPEYRTLVYQSYVSKLHHTSSDDEKWSVFKSIKNYGSLKYDLFQWLAKQVYLKNDSYETYHKIYRKFTNWEFDPGVSINYRRSKRLSRKERELPTLKGFDRFGNKASFKDFNGNKVAIYIYSIRDRNLVENIQLWNIYHVLNKEEIRHFIAVCIDADLNERKFKSIMNSNQLVGFNLEMNFASGTAFLDKLNLPILPTSLTIDNNIITGYNVVENLYITDVINNSITSDLLDPQLGKY